MKMNTINHKASKYHEQYIEKVKRINVIIGKGIQGHKCNDWIHGITIQQGGWCTKMHQSCQNGCWNHYHWPTCKLQKVEELVAWLDH